MDYKTGQEVGLKWKRGEAGSHFCRKRKGVKDPLFAERREKEEGGNSH